MIWLPLLLTDASPCLRYLALRDLFALPAEDEELLELDALRRADPLVTGILSLQESDGSWRSNALATGRLGGSRTLMTAYALTRLSYLGFDRTHPAVARAAEYLFSTQLADGSWPLTEEIALTDGSSELPSNERYSMIPLQTAFPLRGLAACGYAADERAERAYAWLLAQRLEDGAWPTGLAAGVHGYVAGYRRLAHSRWGCRSNTTGALLCLALHPQRRFSPEAHRALDLLLGRETREAHTLGVEVARMVGAEPAQGFFTYFARFDLALLLDLCARIGVTKDDPRLAAILTFLLGLQSEFGLWSYPSSPHIARWLTFDLSRSLARLEADAFSESGWLSTEPRTPFRAYPSRRKRY